MKTCPIVKHFINRRIKILPNTKRTLKNAPKTFKFWQSSEISPNLVTLAGGWGRRCLSSSFLRSPNDQFARLTDNSIIEKKGSCLQTKRLKVNMSERERERMGVILPYTCFSYFETTLFPASFHYFCFLQSITCSSKMAD